MLLDELLQRRLILLTGKGGVGKSVAGAALALLAAERGKRTLLAEVDAPLEATRYLESAPAGGAVSEARPGLFTVNLKPAAVMEEYVRRTVRVERLVRKIVESPVYHRFFSWAPGLRELIVLGKIVVLTEESAGWSRKPCYDLVIADLPATGHGLSMLTVPIRASAAIPFGPIGSQARWILQALRDPARTALLVVAIPEEMAVAEALEFRRSASGELGIEPAALLLNACHERRFSAAEEAEVLRLRSEKATGRLPGGVPLEDALHAAQRHLRRCKLTRFYETRLRRALGAATPLVSLPLLYEDPLGLAALRRLGARLAEA